MEMVKQLTTLQFKKMKPAFTARRVKNEAPAGWTATKRRGKPEWRCGLVHYVFKFNEYRRCTYSCAKKNIKSHIKNHVFDLVQDDDDEFPPNLRKKIMKISHDQFNDKYLTNLATLCGKLDIPCRKASSDPMRDFSLYLLNEGYSFPRDAKTSVNFEQLLDNVSEKRVSEKVIQVSQKVFQKNLESFSQKKYCNLLCDAGTVLKSHCLHFILTYVDDPVDKILFDSFDGQIFDANFYRECFAKVFSKCKSNNIYISSITTDNLPAQTLGWENFKETVDDPFIKIVYRIPCYAHMMNLVFSDVIKRSEKLREYINTILVIVKSIRKTEAIEFIGSKCPSQSTTRWLYIVDILLFILNNREKINDFLLITNNSDILIDGNIEFTYKILVLLKLFSLIVEKDSFQIYNIVPLAREFLNELNLLYDVTENQDWKNIIDIVDSSTRTRLANNSLNETITSYALSGAGQAELRRKYASILTKNPNCLSLTPEEETLSKERIKFEYKKTPLYTEETPINNLVQVEELDVEDEISMNLTTEPDELTKNIDDIMKTPFKERIKTDLYINIYQTAKSELVRIGSLINIEEDYIEQKFDEFLFEDPLQLGFAKYSSNNPYVFWRKGTGIA